MKSINHPWAISDRIRNRFGDVWSDLDFVFNERILEDSFKNDPMNTEIGYVSIFNQKISMLYKDLIAYAKTVKSAADEAYTYGSKADLHEVRIKSQTFTLKPHELLKLSETLNEASNSTVRSYELGLMN
jgi:hypothetical protein